MLHHPHFLIAIVRYFCGLLNDFVEALKRHAPEPPRWPKAQQIHRDMRLKVMLGFPQPIISFDLQ